MEIMRYFTLDGRFSTLSSNHFMLLNHFRHKKRVPFSYYLLASLENGIKDFKRNPKNPILHEGLILLVMEYAKYFAILEEPKKITKVV